MHTSPLARKPKPNINTLDTLLLGMWVEGGRCAIAGTLRNAQGELVLDSVHATGAPWPTLAHVLRGAEIIGCANVVLLTNDRDIIKALSKPFPCPDNDDWWECVLVIGWTFAGHFRAQYAADLPAARAMWNEAIA